MDVMPIDPDLEKLSEEDDVAEKENSLDVENVLDIHDESNSVLSEDPLGRISR